MLPVRLIFRVLYTSTILALYGIHVGGVGVDSETCYGRDAWPTVFNLKLDCSLLLLLVRMPAPVALLPWCVLNEKG